MTARTMLRSLVFTLPWAIAAGVVGPAYAADAPPVADFAAGEEKAKLCVACHGEMGISQQPNYPHLHGQHQTYLLRQMRVFRDGGDRRDPIMTPMLENMTDQDLVNLAAYFSSFSGVLSSHAEDSGSSLPVMPTPATSPTAKAADATSAPAGEQGGAAATQTAGATPAPGAAAAPAAAGDAAAGKTKSAACAACHGMDGRGTTPLFPNLNGQKAEYLVRQLVAFRDGVRQDATMAPMAMALTDQDIADLAAYYAGLQ